MLYNVSNETNLYFVSIRCAKYYISFQIPSTQQMPYPAYTAQDVSFIYMMLPMFLVLSFYLIIPHLMKRIVQEKESGIKVKLLKS